MSNQLRIATFNLENLDDKPGEFPALATRIAVIRPQLGRLNADVICLQEVNGQEVAGSPRRLLALQELLEGTPYENYHVASTTVVGSSQVYNERNLVILSRFPILEHAQHKHRFAPAPQYRKVTANPPELVADDVTWERPLLHARVQLPGARTLHVINVHLKSKRPDTIAGQQLDRFTFRTASGWAEGFFVSAIKRVGQALEARMFIDTLFDADEQAMIVLCGDLNADFDETPVEALRGEVENTGNWLLAGRVMVPCEFTVPEPSRFSLYHMGRPRMIDHILASRPLLAFYRGAEIHNEVLHDESIAFASDVKFPESDHAPVVAEFSLPG